MSKRLMVLSILFSLSFAGCTLPHWAPARLRVTNHSSFTIEQVTLIFPHERITFGPVAAGASSDYQTLSFGVYRYAAYEMQIDGQTIGQAVADWVGEQPLAGDQFTYVLTVDLQQSAEERIRSDVRRE